MQKLLSFISIIALTIFIAFGADNEFRLSGRVKDAVTKMDLTQSKIILYDSIGNPRDSIQANKGFAYRNGEIDTMAMFSFPVPRVDSTYVFDIKCPGYKTLTMSYNLNKIGRREQWRELGVIFLERAPRMLKELTVTSTKIKFYNKGDTLVYNADAFQLAEGSMLDALIAQLPGAELSTDGQIKINGQFVESLLLNGKEFMDGNNNIMLENIGAYTVNNIQVYEGESQESKRKGERMAPKVLTMDVRLKKEYNMGWLINAQAGYGTEDRYIGKLFANWFNATTRVTLLGNVNNLNDNRQPGRNDTWTPDMMPTGTKEYRMGTMNYSYQNAEDTKSINGSVSFEQSVDKSNSTTMLTNFLTGGNTYENRYANNNNKETRLSTRHSGYFSGKGLFNGGAYVNASYSDTKNTNSGLSGAFNEDPQGMTAEILDAIYSNGSTELLESIINRSRTRTDGKRKAANVYADINSYLKIPKTEDRIGLEFGVEYNSEKEKLWKDYDINYGTNAIAAEKRRQYIDNSPNHTLSFHGSIAYSTFFKNLYFSINYTYRFSERIKDSYMYALEHLEDMGIYGVVPGNYLEAFDPANSYTSRTLENRHNITPMLMYFKDTSGGCFNIRLIPQTSIVSRNLDYWRNDRSYKVKTNNAMVNIGSVWSAMIEYEFNKQGENRNAKYRNSIRYSYRLWPELPDMVDMVDVTNDADPLNIYIGNPDLKMQNQHYHLLRWNYSPHSHSFNNTLYLGYTYTDNALSRGYTYDTSTGVRYNKMYNVQGTDRAALTNDLSWQFGGKKQFSLSSSTDMGIGHNVSMVGVDIEEPEKTKVKNFDFTEKVKLTWQFAGQSITLRCDYTNRHSTSKQPGFNTLDANHINYGVSGVFKLPAGFGVSTDFTCYTRRGYGSNYLDTTDPIWNMRLTYSHPRHSRWVFMADGFDLLHKLSNVNYAVTATGRTISYTNALPRYFLFSVQYRLSIQPKKR